MAGRGAAPKENHQRPRDTRRRIDDRAVRVPDEPFTGKVPRLPKRDWDPATLDWYKVWSKSPQAHMFTATDWQFLIETAYLADAFFTGNVTIASELRLRMAKFGATPEDRARLRLQFIPKEEEDPKPTLASVTSIKSKQPIMDLEDE
jgi:hypothetical protein